MNFEIWRGMVEFGLDIQHLVLNNWRFELRYGNHRLDIYDTMVFTKNGETVEVRCYEDIIKLLERVY